MVGWWYTSGALHHTGCCGQQQNSLVCICVWRSRRTSSHQWDGQGQARSGLRSAALRHKLHACTRPAGHAISSRPGQPRRCIRPRAFPTAKRPARATCLQQPARAGRQVQQGLCVSNRQAPSQGNALSAATAGRPVQRALRIYTGERPSAEGSLTAAVAPLLLLTCC